MQINLKSGFAVSFLFHLLIFLSFSLSWVFYPKKIEKRPSVYVPSYVYQPQTTREPVQQQNTPQKNSPVAKTGIEKNVVALSHKMQSNSQSASINISKNTDPVHLIGDKNVDKPLLTLLGKALSAKLSYPKIAVDFNVRGIVGVGFRVYPDGHLTDIQLVKSSRETVLDEAALTAVRAMIPVKNVNLYLHEPEYLVVGIIFG